MKFPLTLKTFNKVFSKIGEVMKIVLFNKNNQLQALIQFHDAATAKKALLAMDNKNIYDGCCSLRIDYSKIEDLAVKYNNEKTWDYTKPDLPSYGPEIQISYTSYTDAVEYHRGNMRESNERYGANGGDVRGRNEGYRGGKNEGFGEGGMRGRNEGYGGGNMGERNMRGRNEGYGRNMGYGGGNMRGMGAMGYGGGNMSGSNERYGEGNMGYGGRNEGYGGGDMRERNERFGGGDMRGRNDGYGGGNNSGMGSMGYGGGRNDGYGGGGMGARGYGGNRGSFSSRSVHTDHSSGSSYADNQGSSSSFSSTRLTPPPPGEGEPGSSIHNETNKTGNKRRLSPDLTEDKSNKKARKDSTEVTEGSSLLICYDLELTDGSFASEIYQIGAKCRLGSFSKNILPQGNIDWGVTKFATNITVQHDDSGSRSLFDIKSKEYVTSSSSKECFGDFLKWIEEQKNLGKYKDVVLVAQGSTDMNALINNMARDGLMKNLLDNVDMFGDSLKYFQTNFKNWKKFSVPIVYANVFPDRKGFKAHSAHEDATALHDILEKLNEKNDRKDFVRKIKQESLNSSVCPKIVSNQIQKTLSKSSKNPKNQNSGVIRFFAIKGYN